MKIIGFFLVLVCAACMGAAVGSSEVGQDRTISVSVTVPDMAWKIRIEEIYYVKGDLLVISRLTRADGHGAQAISVVSDSMRIKAPESTIRHYILGKTWKWRNTESYTFLNSRDEIAGMLMGGVRLYP